MEQKFKHFENSLGVIYGSIRYHAQQRMVTVTWKGTASEEAIIKVKNEALVMVREQKALFILNDFQNFYSAATQKLTSFIRASWDKEAFNLGVAYIVHVLKPEMEIPADYAKNNPNSKFFYSKLDAVEWIEKELKTLR